MNIYLLILKKTYNMRKFNEFVGLYPISKTLRFELKPIGKTLEHIQRNKLLEEDAVRADDYVKVKKIIDKYHKYASSLGCDLG